MKKVLFLSISVFLFASQKGVNQKDVYIDYTNKIINYNFQLEGINDIKSPFYIPYKNIVETNGTKRHVEIKKSVKISLISIFGDKAYVQIDHYIGEQLVKSEKKWIKINDEIVKCKLIKLTETDAYFKCKDKTLHKSLNKKIPLLGDGK